MDKVNMTGKTARSFKGQYSWIIGPQLMFLLERYSKGHRRWINGRRRRRWAE